MDTDSLGGQIGIKSKVLPSWESTAALARHAYPCAASSNHSTMRHAYALMAAWKNIGLGNPDFGFSSSGFERALNSGGAQSKTNGGQKAERPRLRHQSAPVLTTKPPTRRIKWLSSHCRRRDAVWPSNNPPPERLQAAPLGFDWLQSRR